MLQTDIIRVLGKTGWKMIHWELCKRLKYDPTDKWYRHKPEANLEIERNNILWDFDTQTDHSIQVKNLVFWWIFPF